MTSVVQNNECGVRMTSAGQDDNGGWLLRVDKNLERAFYG